MDKRSTVYVSNAHSLDIRVFHLEEEGGRLSGVQTLPVPEVTAPSPISMPLAVSADRRFLHAAVRSEPFTLKTFGIAPDGRLSYLGSTPLPQGMAYLSFDRSGRFMLFASYSGHTVSVSPVAPSGRVGPVQQTLALSASAHAVMTDPANRYVLYTAIGSDRFVCRRFDAATGKIGDEDLDVVIRPKAAPRHFVFHPHNGCIYLLNERDATIDIIGFEPGSGALQLRGSVSSLPPGFSGQPMAADIHVTPDGRYLYSSERGSNTIAAYRCGSDSGTLALIGHFPTEAEPRSLAMDPQGRFLLAAGQASHALTVYRIVSASGGLQALGSWPMGQNPSWIEILDIP